MTDSPKKRAFIVRSFKDEGSGESFERGSTPLVGAGAYSNYEAAGLVTAPPATKAPAKAPTATKPASKPKGKAKPKTARASVAAPEIPAQPVTAPVVGAADA